jgi:hypothetical protein
MHTSVRCLHSCWLPWAARIILGFSLKLTPKGVVFSFFSFLHAGLPRGAGTPCSMKDGSCLTDRKSTHMEAHGSTLILTVDDEPTNHLVIEEIVTSQGYQVQRFCASFVAAGLLGRLLQA